MQKSAKQMIFQATKFRDREGKKGGRRIGKGSVIDEG